MPAPPPPEHMDSIDEACKVSQAQAIINGALVGHGLGAAINAGDVLLRLAEQWRNEPEEAKDDFLPRPILILS